MYKNQLQELAQRSCFNLPSYACIREGPDHAPRFKAIVTFNGEAFESPSFCPTLRQAEHAAAEVALSTLSNRGPSHSIGARMLDETGVCKNLLQETAHRGGVSLPVYTTIRSGPGHLPVFTCIVEVGGQKFVGDVAKTKKQAEKNAAMAALAALKSATGSNLQLITTEASALQASGSRRKVKVSHGRDRSAYREAKHFGFRQPGCGNNNGASSSLLPYHSQLPSSMAGLESSMLSREASTLSRPASRPVEKMMPVRVRNLMPSVQEDSRTQLEEHFRDGKEWLQEEVLKAVLQDEEADSYSLGIWGGSSKTWGRQTAPAPTGMLMPVQVIGLPSSSRDFKPQLEEHFRDEEEWLHGETPKPSLRNGEGSSYNQGMWTGSSPNWGCQFATSYSNNIGNMMPVQVRSLPSSSRTNFKAQLEEHLRDEEDWLSGGTRKAVLRNQEASSYTPRMWEASQNWTCQSQAGATAYSNNPFQFHSVASAAPPVTVRQVATVCSAPPRRVDIAPKVRQEETADKELESLESFSQLRL